MNGSLKVCGWQECPNEYDRGALPLVADFVVKVVGWVGEDCD
jgi:hypothetical protein